MALMASPGTAVKTWVDGMGPGPPKSRLNVLFCRVAFANHCFPIYLVEGLHFLFLCKSTFASDAEPVITECSATDTLSRHQMTRCGYSIGRYTYRAAARSAKKHKSDEEENKRHIVQKNNVKNRNLESDESQ